MALKTHRQGNDFKLTLQVYRLNNAVSVSTDIIPEGAIPEDLTNAQNIKLSLYCSTGACTVLKKTVNVNTLVAEIPTSVQDIGTYFVLLEYDVVDISFADGLKRITVDFDAFKIVCKSAYADTEGDMSLIGVIKVGLDGKSAYQYAQEHGYLGTEEEFGQLQYDATLAAVNEAERIIAESDREQTFDTQMDAVDSAIGLAGSATDNANLAATNANDKATLANNAATNADSKAQLAETATSNADIATGLANTATTNANNAASNADSKATLANNAAINADNKAGLADQKATLANNAAIAANTATGNANTATTNANSAALAANSLAGTYNVTVAVPLGAGLYYTSTTARTAVPTANRLLGRVITYSTASGVWYSEKFIGTDVANWTVEGNWERVPDNSQIIQLGADLNQINADNNVIGFTAYYTKTAASSMTSFTLAISFYNDGVTIPLFKIKHSSGSDIVNFWKSGDTLYLAYGANYTVKLNAGINNLVFSASPTEFNFYLNGATFAKVEAYQVWAKTLFISSAETICYIGLSNTYCDPTTVKTLGRNLSASQSINTLYNIVNVSYKLLRSNTVYDVVSGAGIGATLVTSSASNNNKTLSLKSCSCFTTNYFFRKALTTNYSFGIDFIFDGVTAPTFRLMYSSATRIGFWMDNGILRLSLDTNLTLGTIKKGRHTLTLTNVGQLVDIYFDGVAVVKGYSYTLGVDAINLSGTKIVAFGLSDNVTEINSTAMEDLSRGLFNAYNSIYIDSRNVTSEYLKNLSNDDYLPSVNTLYYEQYSHRVSDYISENNQYQCAVTPFRKTSKATKCNVSFIDDDGTKKAMTGLYPFMTARNIPFGVAMIAGNLNTSGYITDEELIFLKNNGIEILNHTWQHNALKTYALKDQIELIKKAHIRLSSIGLQPTALVLPYGSYNADTIDASSRIYPCTYHFGSNGVNNIGTLKNHYVKRVSFDDTLTSKDYAGRLAAFKAIIDDAVANKSWLVFTTHTENYEWASDSYTLLDELITYMTNQGVDFVLPSEGFRRYGNLAENDNGKVLTAALDIVQI